MLTHNSEYDFHLPHLIVKTNHPTLRTEPEVTDHGAQPLLVKGRSGCEEVQ